MNADPGEHRIGSGPVCECGHWRSDHQRDYGECLVIENGWCACRAFRIRKLARVDAGKAEDGRERERRDGAAVESEAAGARAVRARFMSRSRVRLSMP
jgi:hypothetical protein